MPVIWTETPPARRSLATVAAPDGETAADIAQHARIIVTTAMTSNRVNSYTQDANSLPVSPHNPTVGLDSCALDNQLELVWNPNGGFNF